MNLYKITFSNNEAVSAAQIYNTPDKNVQIENIWKHPEVKWVTVFADDERESIKVANKVSKEYLASLHMQPNLF